MKVKLFIVALTVLLMPVLEAQAEPFRMPHTLGPAFNAAARRPDAPLGLADAPGVAWKMVSLAQGWNVQIPAYWKDCLADFSTETLESVFGNIATGEAVILGKAGPDPVLLELLGTPDEARFRQLLPEYRQLAESMLAEEGATVVSLEHRIAEFGVGGYGAWRVHYRVSYPDMQSAIAKVRYIVPFAGGSCHLTVVGDARALETTANLLASRMRIQHAMYPGGVDAHAMSEERCTTIVDAK